MQSAVDAAAPGDRILLRDGVYSENLTITRGGTASAPVTIAAQGSNAVIRGKVAIAAPYVTLTGVTLSGSASPGGFISGNAITVTKSNATIDRVRIESYAGWAVEFKLGYGDARQQAKNGTVTANSIYNVSGGVQLVDGTLAQGNDIERMNVHGNGNLPGDAFRVFGSGAVIRGNSLHGTIRAEVEPAHADAVQSWDDIAVPVKDVLVEGNSFRGWVDQGVILENDTFGWQSRYYISDWTIRNNVFAGFGAWGVLAGKPNGGVPNVSVTNNTIIGSDAPLGYYGVAFVGRGGSGTIQNNLVIDLQEASYFADSGARVSASHNLVFDAPAPASSTGTMVGRDPLLVDPAKGDFRLTAGSPAIDAGTAVSFTSDGVGGPRKRGAATDIGAIEFAAAAPVPPAPAPPTATPTPTPTPTPVSNPTGYATQKADDRLAYSLKTACSSGKPTLTVNTVVMDDVALAISVQSAYGSTEGATYFDPKVRTTNTFAASTRAVAASELRIGTYKAGSWRQYTIKVPALSC